MKKLLWKELMEHRWTPLVYGVLVSLAVVVRQAFGGTATDAQSLTDARTVLYTALVLAGLFPASAAIASEVGNGTLTFLTSLPSGRARIWCAKLCAGLIVVAGSVVCIMAAYAMTLRCCVGAAADRALAGQLESSVSSIVFILCGYAIAFFFSTMVDRALTAAVLAIIGAAGLLSLMATLDLGEAPATVVFCCAAAALLTASYVAFVKGDAMRSWRHIGLAAVVLACWLPVGGAAAWACIAIGKAQDAAHLRMMESVAHPNPRIVIAIVDDPTAHFWRDQTCDLDAVTIGLTYRIHIPLVPIPGATLTPRGAVASAGDPTDDAITASVDHERIAGIDQIAIDIAYTPKKPEGVDLAYIPLHNQAGQSVGLITLRATKYILRGQPR